MSDTKAKRGRPKGSGIDDSAILNKISSLIAANPELKPTTAIKELGYTDPSTIRRLRDKYKQLEQLITRSSPNPIRSGFSSAIQQHSANSSTSLETRSVALDSQRDHRLIGPFVPAFTKKNAKVKTQDSSHLTRTNKTPSIPNKKQPSHKTTRGHKPNLTIPSQTEYPDMGPSPFLAGLIAWQEGLKAYREATEMQSKHLQAWINAPATQMVMQQQVQLARVMMAAWPQTGFFQNAAYFWAAQLKR